MENMNSAATLSSDACCLVFLLIRKAKGSPLFFYTLSVIKYLKGQFFSGK